MNVKIQHHNGYSSDKLPATLVVIVQQFCHNFLPLVLTLDVPVRTYLLRTSIDDLCNLMDYRENTKKLSWKKHFLISLHSIYIQIATSSHISVILSYL